MAGAHWHGHPCVRCGETLRYAKPPHRCVACVKVANAQAYTPRPRPHKVRPPRQCATGSWHRSRIINALRQAAGGIVAKKELIAILWPPGTIEPDWAEKVVHKEISDLRRKFGYPIETHGNRGYSYRWTTWEVSAEPTPSAPAVALLTQP